MASAQPEAGVAGASGGPGAIASLTGLRGIAALSVLVEHYSVWCAPYDRMQAPEWLWRSMGNSHFGMSLFFTLSGFVIAYNYLAFDWGRRAAASAGRFAWLRFSRLYPVLLIYLALLYVRPPMFGDQTPAAQLMLLFSVESLYPVRLGGHWLTDPLCWSISTEIALYAGFVVCAVAFRKARQRFGGAATVMAVGLSVAYLTTIAWLIYHPDARVLGVLTKLPAVAEPVSRAEATYWFFYWSPYARFYDFAFGWMAAAAVLRGFHLPPWLDDWALPICCVVLWLAWVLAGPSGGPKVLQPLTPPLFATIMVARPLSRISRALSVPALLFIGEISYSLYLFHPFATNLADHARGQPFSWLGFVDFCSTFALDFVIALALAAGLYRVVEMPAQRALRRLMRARWRPAVPAASVTSPVPDG